jgi:iron(III) transport system permease protein
VIVKARWARKPALDQLPIFAPALFLLVACLVLVPLALMLVASFQLAPPGRPRVYGLDGWQRVFTDPTILEAIGNTVSLAVTRQAIGFAIGLTLAWLIARTDLLGRNALEFLLWVVFILPPLPATMGWLLLLDGQHGLVNRWLRDSPFSAAPLFDIYSFWGIVWVHLVTGTIAVKVILLAPAFRNLDAALEEAAMTSGATTAQTLRRIVIPLMAPAVLVSVILSTIRSLESFEIEMLLGTPIGLMVFATKIYDLVIFEPPKYGPATALGSLFLLVLLVLVILERLYVSRGTFTTVTGRGFSARPLRLGSWRYPVSALAWLLALVMSAVPTGALLLGTFMTRFGYFDLVNPWTLENWRRVLGDQFLLGSIRNTVILGVSAALVGIALYSLVAYVIVKTRFAARGALDLISWLPWAVPGVLLSLALLWSVLETRVLMPIYGTVYLLSLAIIIKNLPVGTQLTGSVLLQISNELEEAARVSGASWLQTYYRVLVPLLLPTFSSIALLVFVSAARDISTVVLLGSNQSRTIALLSLDYASAGQFEPATVASVITVVIVVVAALLARAVSGRVGHTGV